MILFLGKIKFCRQTFHALTLIPDRITLNYINEYRKEYNYEHTDRA